MAVIGPTRWVCSTCLVKNSPTPQHNPASIASIAAFMGRHHTGGRRPCGVCARTSRNSAPGYQARREGRPMSISRLIRWGGLVGAAGGALWVVLLALYAGLPAAAPGELREGGEDLVLLAAPLISAG